MADPDVEYGGDAVGGPGSSFDRRRNPLLLAIGILLLVVGIGAAAIGLIRLIGEAGPQDDQVLVRGEVAALDGQPQVALFEHDGPVTIWIEVSGNEQVADTQVAGTLCRLTSGDGGTQEIQGNVQGSSLTIGNEATVGEAEARGRNVVTCGHVPWGSPRNRDRLENSPPFLVEAGTPGDGLLGLWLLLPGVAAALLAVWPLVRWNSGSLRRR